MALGGAKGLGSAATGGTNLQASSASELARVQQEVNEIEKGLGVVSPLKTRALNAVIAKNFAKMTPEQRLDYESEQWIKAHGEHGNIKTQKEYNEIALANGDYVSGVSQPRHYNPNSPAHAPEQRMVSSEPSNRGSASSASASDGYAPTSYFRGGEAIVASADENLTALRQAAQNTGMTGDQINQTLGRLNGALKGLSPAEKIDAMSSMGESLSQSSSPELQRIGHAMNGMSDMLNERGDRPFTKNELKEYAQLAKAGQLGMVAVLSQPNGLEKFGAAFEGNTNPVLRNLMAVQNQAVSSVAGGRDEPETLTSAQIQELHAQINAKYEATVEANAEKAQLRAEIRTEKALFALDTSQERLAEARLKDGELAKSSNPALRQLGIDGTATETAKLQIKESAGIMKGADSQRLTALLDSSAAAMSGAKAEEKGVLVKVGEAFGKVVEVVKNTFGLSEENSTQATAKSDAAPSDRSKGKETTSNEPPKSDLVQKAEDLRDLAQLLERSDIKSSITAAVQFEGKENTAKNGHQSADQNSISIGSLAGGKQRSSGAAMDFA